MSIDSVPTPILTAFAALGRAYRNWPITDDVIITWTGLLQDVPPDEFLRAAIEHARTSKFPPTPAEIAALALRPDQEQLTAEEAWSEVMSEIRRVGWCGVPTLSTPQIERALAGLGSWRSICSQTTEQLAANRAHFLRLYSAFAKVKAREVACLEADEIAAKLMGGAPRKERLEAMYGAPECDLDEPYGERDQSIIRAHTAEPAEESDDEC